jgi:NADH:ubiquinone oxidoreductase subunit 6 (subunit J)
MALSLWLPLLIGAAAVFVLLPRPRPLPAVAGVAAALAALALAAWHFLIGVGLSVESFLFLVFSALAIASGLLLVTQQNPARAALSFALVVLSTCGLFLLLAAPFLTAATIVVYAGAIVVTFLFVIMLAQQAGLSDADARSREPLLAVITGAVLLAALLHVIHIAWQEPDDLVEQMLEIAYQTDARVAAGDTAALESFPERLKEPLMKVFAEEEKREAEPSYRPSRRVLLASRLRDDLDNDGIPRLPSPDEATPESRREAVAGAIRYLQVARVQLRRALDAPAFGLPAAGAAASPDPLSPLSGPRANVPAAKLRLDRAGTPQLPAENAQYLGRSLFTDYLVPVELGGVLLLVATVGAIAIAQRRLPREARR